MIDTSQKVYFARCIDPDGKPMNAYKIGCSHGWNDRIKQVTTNLPFSLEVVAVAPGCEVTEAACLMYLKKHRIRGEYIRANAFTDEFIEMVAERGRPFHYLDDLGYTGYDNDFLPPFLAYHAITLGDACRRHGTNPDKYKNSKVVGKNKRLIAAAALVAMEREQYVTWPVDITRGLLGQRAYKNGKMIDPLPEAEARAQ